MLEQEAVMNTQSRLEVTLRFLRATLLMDAILAAIVWIITLLLDLHTWWAYGTLLVWTGFAVIVLACLLGVGGVSSRLQDVGAYSLSGAGKDSELFRHIAEAGQSSLGCFFLFAAAGIGVLAIGYLFRILFVLFG
jgi:hypothetical protein